MEKVPDDKRGVYGFAIGVDSGYSRHTGTFSISAWQAVIPTDRSESGAPTTLRPARLLNAGELNEP